MTQNTQFGFKLEPQILSDKLSAFGEQYKAIPFQKFKGIHNKSPNGKKGYYCFLISFFQLFFHIDDVLIYLNNSNLQNNTELLLSHNSQKLISNRKDSAIKIYNFILT